MKNNKESIMDKENKKYLLTFEVRKKNNSNKIFTIGIFESLVDACSSGNSLLEAMEGIFPLRIYYNGETSERSRLGINNGLLKTPVKLITNLGYLVTPFDFYLKITVLDCYKKNEIIDYIK